MGKENRHDNSQRRPESGNSYKGIDPAITGIVRRTALRAIGKAGFQEDDLPDIEQELMLAVFKGLKKFNSELGMQVTLAKHIIERRMKTIIASRFSLRRDWRLCTTSLNDEIFFDEDGGETVELMEMVDNEQRLRLEIPCEKTEDFAELLDLKMDIEQMCSRLSPCQRKICEIMKTNSRRKTAKCLNVSRDDVDSALETITSLLLE